MSKPPTKTVALEFLTALKDRDIERLEALLAEDYDYWLIGDLPYSGSLNKTKFLELVNSLCRLMEGPLTIDVDDITAEEDRVSITAKGNMVAVNGSPYINHYHFLFTIKDGKILKLREYLDAQKVKDLLLSFSKGGE